jgi:hypothetical protein
MALNHSTTRHIKFKNKEPIGFFNTFEQALTPETLHERNHDSLGPAHSILKGIFL